MIDSKFVLAELEKIYPNPHCELNFENNYQLIVAVILSAQCTDKRVNMVTPALFEKYPTIETLASADVRELESMIKTCGLYKAKAKNLIAMSQKVVEKFGKGGIFALSLHPLKRNGARRGDGEFHVAAAFWRC